MADLTADAPLRLKGEGKTEKFFIDTAAANVFYKGQPAWIDQTGDTTNVIPFVGASGVDPTDVCVGIAAEGKTVVLGAAETTEIEVYTAPSIVGFKSTVFTTNASLGTTIYMSDSGVLSVTATDHVQIGKLFKVEDGYCYVELTTPQICASAT
jgi:hypothetical protein